MNTPSSYSKSKPIFRLFTRPKPAAQRARKSAGTQPAPIHVPVVPSSPKPFLHEIKGTNSRIFVSSKWNLHTQTPSPSSFASSSSTTPATTSTSTTSPLADKDPKTHESTTFKRIKSELQKHKITHILSVDVNCMEREFQSGKTWFFKDLEYYGSFKLATATVPGPGPGPGPSSSINTNTNSAKEKPRPLDPYRALLSVEDNFLNTINTMLYHRKYDPAYTLNRVLDPSNPKEGTIVHSSEHPRKTNVVLYGPRTSVLTLLVLFFMNREREPMELNEALRVLVLSCAGGAGGGGGDVELEPKYLDALMKYEENVWKLTGEKPSFVIKPEERLGLKTKEDVSRLLLKRFKFKQPR